MSWWQRHFGTSTRGRIVALLRRGRRTVEELAGELGLTDNAVRAQLASLERDGMVRPAGVLREGNVGKPATVYDIAPEAQPVFSSAYAPVLSALLDELSTRMSPDTLELLMKDVGRRLAPEPGTAPSTPADLGKRVRAAAALLDSLGGATSVERRGADYVIRGFGCPLSEAVGTSPKVCCAVQELLTNVTSAEVRECCDRSDGARCRFEVSIPAVTGS